MNEYGLSEIDNKIIDKIFKNYSNIEEVFLFGSRARNTFKPTSDIDLVIKGSNLSSIIGTLIDDFEESDLIYEVDIVDYEKITNKNLIKHIKKFGKLIYKINK